MATDLPPRVRFAPAPSGWLHVGSVRTALYNWLYARRHGGTFVMRIEDTDAERATQESMDSMLDAMTWMGLDVDEGVRGGGPYAPYRQSERVALHQAVARRLDEAGYLYRDERTPEQMQAWRDDCKERKVPATVKQSTTPAATGEGEATLRLALPEEGATTVHDLVRGDVTWDWAHQADPVLVRSDGSPTYPLANTVDDVAQGITLVCRGEDLLSVTPRQVFLYDLLIKDGLIDEALAEVGLPPRDPSWTRPTEFAHLSMIVGMDRKKLSKRHGSVAIQEFARQGFMPETLVNYLALLGWSPGDDRERMHVDEMIAAFSFENVGNSAAAFDVDKLTAFNGERIRALSTDELAARLVPHLDGTYEEAIISSPPSDEEMATLRGLVPLVQERMQRLDEVENYAPSFFTEGVELDPASVDKILRKDGAVEVLEAAIVALEGLDDFSDEGVEAALRGLTESLSLGARKVFQPIRVAATGSAVSPPLFESVALLGRDRVLARLRAAIPVAAERPAGE